jgi:hypothetical protein
MIVADKKSKLETVVNIPGMSGSKLLALSQYGKVLQNLGAMSLASFEETMKKFLGDKEKLDWLRQAMYELASFAYHPIYAMAESMTQAVVEGVFEKLKAATVEGAAAEDRQEQEPPKEVIDQMFNMAFGGDKKIKES